MFKKSVKQDNNKGGKIKHVLLLLLALILPFGFILLGLYYLYSKKSGQKEST